MDPLIGSGLTLQVVALILLFRRLGGGWFTHIGAVFIVAATAYHGLNEILLWLFPDRDVYRLLVAPNYVGQFALWVSVAILLFTLAYLATLAWSPGHRGADESEWQRARIRRVFDWRLMIVAVVPLMVLTVAGQGYISGAAGPTPAQTLDFGAGLSLQFLLLASAFASFGIITRFGQRWLLPMLLIQSAMLALAGQRLEILVTVGLLLYALARVGISLKRTQLVLSMAVLLLAALVLTSARAAEGRLSTASNGFLRFDFLTAGIGNIGSADTWNLVAADLGYRLDGNSFGSMELQSLDSGSAPLGAQPLLNDLELAIPSFLNPDKNSSALEKRSEKNYAELYLSLPLPEVYSGVPQDILPTQLGATVGFWGPWGMLFVALFLGVVFGMSDRWILRRLSPTRLLVGVALLSCVLFYEKSWDTYSVTFRGVLVLLPWVWAVQGYRFSRSPNQRNQRPSFSSIT
jgi:hypothetical protein